MKTNLFLTTAAIAALTLAGCQKTEPAMSLGDNDTIGFAPYMGRSVTKGAVTDLTASNFSSFNAACYLTGTDIEYFIPEETVSKNASGIWETADTHLWPEIDKLDFFAYFGSGSSAVSNTDGVAKVSYTVPDTADDDFVVACSVNQGKPSSSPYTQELSFSHALTKLSRLTLVPRPGDVEESEYRRFTVTDVRIVAAKTGADYTFNPTSGSNWVAASGDKDYVFSDTEITFACDSSHTFGTGTSPKVNDQLILLPQTVTFSVTYSVEYSRNGGKTWSKLLSSSTKTASIEMEMGKAYAINLQLPFDSTPIAFSTSLSGWDESEEVDNEVATVFSVSASKKVNFTKGNLYWDGNAFHLEGSQTAFPTTWNASHVGYFFWSSTASVAYAESYSDPSATSSDKFFCGEDNKLTVDGRSDLYALSNEEWVYLMDTRTDANRFAKARINGVNGLVIFPDGYNVGTAITEVTGIAAVNAKDVAFPSDNVADWSAMEEAGCVFLPAAGSYHEWMVNNVGLCGYYHSSTLKANNIYSISIESNLINFSDNSDRRDFTKSIRLVYDAL